jgi:hypothetical protein
MTTNRRTFLLLLGTLPFRAYAADANADPLADLLWVKRPLIIFADNPSDPRLDRQLRALEREREELEKRDVVIIVDTEPGPSRFETTALRQKFRPHDFNVLLVGKDGSVKMRRPVVVTAFDVMRLIDRLPLRQEEINRR